MFGLRILRKALPLLIITILALAAGPTLAVENHTSAVPAAPAAAQPVSMTCPFSNDGGDLLSRGFYITFPGNTLDTVTLQYIIGTLLPEAETFSVTLTARLNTYDGTLVGQVTESFEGTPGDAQQVTFDFGSASVPHNSTITFTQTLNEGTSELIFFDVGTGPLGEPAPSLCNGFTETTSTTPPLDSFRRDTVGAIVTGSFTPPGGGSDAVSDNPGQAGGHANSHACEDNPGKAKDHRPGNIPPCR